MRAIEKKLRARIVDLEHKNTELVRVRDAFRAHYASRFRWWVELLGKGTGPSVPWLIEDDAKLMAKVGSWWWG